MPQTSHHDALFKEIFSNPEHAEVQLRAILPRALVEKIDWKSLRVEPSSFVEVAQKDRHADLLYRVTIESEDAYLYLLFEHQSTFDAAMLVRLLEYMAKIYRRILRDRPRSKYLVPVLPLLLHHGPNGWGASVHFHDLFAPGLLDQLGLRDLVPSFRFILDDLSQATDEDLHRRAEHAASKVVPVVLWALRDARKSDQFFTSLLTWLGAIAVARRSPSGKDAITAVFKYISLIAENLTPNDILAAVEQAAPETKDTVMTLAEIWTQQGIEKGIERGRLEGIEKGIEKGERAIVAKLLTLKFGKLDEAARSRLETATPADLELWAERILTASSVDEVMG